MRVVFYWLKYLLLGVFLAVAAMGSGDVHGLDVATETRFRTQLVSAAGGPLLASLCLGVYVQSTYGSNPTIRLLVVGVGALWGVHTLVSWWMIGTDLRNRA